MRIGTKLTAIDPCADKYSGQPYLTIGKEYKVISHRGRFFYIIGDDGREHSFGIPHYETYFQSITPDSLDELGFEKKEWQDEGETFHEWVNEFGAIKIQVNSAFQIHIETSREYMRLPNCKTLTDLKHLIRILGV